MNRLRWTLACLHIGLASLLLTTAPGFAETHRLIVDPDQTEVTFLLEATGHDVQGHLYLRDGVLELDPVNGKAAGTLNIDATRTESGNDKRDKTMHKKVLESEQYPLIVFRAEKLVGDWQSDGEVALEGTVEIGGDTHPLTLPTSLEFEGETWQATTTFTVPYVEWGMHDPSLLFLRVAKEVQVTVAAQGRHEGVSLNEKRHGS